MRATKRTAGPACVRHCGKDRAASLASAGRRLSTVSGKRLRSTSASASGGAVSDADRSKRVELRFYYDYRSPFSYLAKDHVYALEDAYPTERLRVDWLPFAFPVEEGFGLPGSRGLYHLNKVKYAYTDVRRWANERDPPLVIKGPQRVFDSTFALAGGLYAQTLGRPIFRAYTDKVFKEFFERKLDIEELAAIKATLQSAIQGSAEGASRPEWEKEFDAFLTAGAGVQEKLTEIRRNGEAEGVFGVPSFVVGGELYFGNDRFHWVSRRVSQLMADRLA